MVATYQPVAPFLAGWATDGGASCRLAAAKVQEKARLMQQAPVQDAQLGLRVRDDLNQTSFLRDHLLRSLQLLVSARPEHRHQTHPWRNLSKQTFSSLLLYRLLAPLPVHFAEIGAAAEEDLRSANEMTGSELDSPGSVHRRPHHQAAASFAMMTEHKQAATDGRPEVDWERLLARSVAVR